MDVLIRYPYRTLFGLYLLGLLIAASTYYYMGMRDFDGLSLHLAELAGKFIIWFFLAALGGKILGRIRKEWQLGGGILVYFGGLLLLFM